MSTQNKKNRAFVRARRAAAVLLAMGAAAVPLWAGTPPERSVTISNTGDETLQLTEVSLSAGFVRGKPTARECGPALSPGRQCEITIRFAPTQVGPQSGTLTVSTNDPRHPNLVVELKGTGVP